MAAYAALVTVTSIVEQIQNHHSPPITFRADQVHSLLEQVGFLRDFLENASHGEALSRDLESKIADAAYAAADVIESFVVDRIFSHDENYGQDFRRLFEDQLTDKHNENLCQDFQRVIEDQSSDQHHEIFCQDLQRVIEDLGVIKREALKIQESWGVLVGELPIPKYALPLKRNIPVVGLDNLLIETMDLLTGQGSARHILPIVGMGGIGKTTLARKAYDNLCIAEHFPVRFWVTISQDYSVREILLGALSWVTGTGDHADLSEDEIGENLYKSLIGRKYLTVMDDMWSIDAWEKVKFFFPDEDYGSRIMITTRTSSLAADLGSSAINMNFLDKIRSWDLLSQQVFGQESCPVELEKTGKKIAKNCRGLPLSIVVVGGLLANKERTREFWNFVAENLHSIVNSEEEGHCSKILSLSYNYLPVHLKPCFLYMGIFPEDSEIRAGELIRLWVSEGFLKPIEGKSLEMVAQSYIYDLIDRNLILDSGRGSDGSVKFCRMHDLLREFCIREAQREKFISCTSLNNQEDSRSMPRRVSIQRRVSTENSMVSLATRSLINEVDADVKPLNLRLLRIFNGVRYPRQVFHQLVNLHFISIGLTRAFGRENLFPMHLLWNLQTLIVKGLTGRVDAPPEFWEMSQLRHVEVGSLFFPDHSNSGKMVRPMNLQTLKGVKNYDISEDVVKRIHDLKRLKIFLNDSDNGINEFGCLEKLISLSCYFIKKIHMKLAFPMSLKKLTLLNSKLPWEYMTKIGSLPYLQVLKLKRNSFIGSTWNPLDGEFLSLKFLQIEYCLDLTYWRAEASHFPRLERLRLYRLHHLSEIPLEIGEIATLELIQVFQCSNSADESARRILAEQESTGIESLRVEVK